MRVMRAIVVAALSHSVSACAVASRDDVCKSASDSSIIPEETPCARGLVCVSSHSCDTSVFSICVPVASRVRGEPCTADADCADGLACAADPSEVSDCVNHCGGTATITGE